MCLSNKIYIMMQSDQTFVTQVGGLSWEGGEFKGILPSHDNWAFRLQNLEWIWTRFQGTQFEIYIKSFFFFIVSVFEDAPLLDGCWYLMINWLKRIPSLFFLRTVMFALNLLVHGKHSYHVIFASAPVVSCIRNRNTNDKTNPSFFFVERKTYFTKLKFPGRRW